MVKILCNVVWLARVVALALNVSTSRAFAQAASGADPHQLPRQFLKKAVPRRSHLQAPGKNGGITKNAATANAGVPGIDSLANWTGQFTAPGFDGNNNPQSVWPFQIVRRAARVRGYDNYHGSNRAGYGAAARPERSHSKIKEWTAPDSARDE
jgi:hypothetical protein